MNETEGGLSVKEKAKKETAKREVTYRWKLFPGKNFFIKEGLHGDKEDWHPTEVELGHKVIVGRGRLTTAKGGGKIGYATINEVEGGPFFSNDVFVSAGKEVRIFFRKKLRLDQPKIPNFPRIPKNK